MHLHALVPLLAALASALPQAAPPPPKPARLLHNFTPASPITGLVPREGGQLLLSLAARPTLYLLDPASRAVPVALHTFPDATSVTALAALTPTRVAALVASPAGSTLHALTFSSNTSSTLSAAPRPLLQVPPAITLLAPARWDLASDVPADLLLAAPTTGTLYALDPASNSLSTLLTDPLLVGLTDMAHLEETLYATSSASGGVVVSIPMRDRRPAGPAKVLRALPAAASLALAGWSQGENAALFVASAAGELSQLDVFDGRLEAVAAGIDGPARVAVGVTETDTDTIFVGGRGGVWTVNSWEA